MNYLFVFIICISVKIEATPYCQWNAECPYRYFSSKTPYDMVRGDIRDSIVMLKDCEPISIWGMTRHGKRHPSRHFGKYMKEAIAIRDYVLSSYEKGNSSLCAQDVQNLRDWPLNNKMFEEMYQLSDEGYKEMLELGRRIKQAFPKLLTKLNEGTYNFRPAYGDWIKKSAAGFVEGLNDDNLKIEDAIPGYDILAPYATCGKYLREVKKNEHIYDEVDKYKKTSDYLKTKDRIERRTGVSRLTDVNITALYDLCRYTTSGVNNISPWCALFTPEDLIVLEYIGDLRHYYRNSYGYPFNEKFGQIPMADLLKSFSLAKEGKGKVITAYISHATMLDMIYVALGLFHDKELTGAERDPYRKLRTSRSTGFSANLIAVLNKCTKDNAVDYNVVFYLNEEPIKELCKEGVCTWKEFEDKLGPFANTTLGFCEVQTASEYLSHIY